MEKKGCKLWNPELTSGGGKREVGRRQGRSSSGGTSAGCEAYEQGRMVPFI